MQELSCEELPKLKPEAGTLKRREGQFKLCSSRNSREAAGPCPGKLELEPASEARTSLFFKKSQGRTFIPKFQGGRKEDQGRRGRFLCLFLGGRREGGAHRKGRRTRQRGEQCFEFEGSPTSQNGPGKPKLGIQTEGRWRVLPSFSTRKT